MEELLSGSRRHAEPEVRLKVREGRVMTAEERDMDEAIWLAGRSGDFSKVWSCLRAKLDPNYRRFLSSIQESALHCAAWCGDEAAARRLLGAGARVYPLDGLGRSAADIARAAHHADLAEILEAQLQRELGPNAAAIIAAAAPGAQPRLEAAAAPATAAAPASDGASGQAADGPGSDAFVVDYYLVDSASSATAKMAAPAPVASGSSLAEGRVDASVEAEADRAKDNYGDEEAVDEEDESVSHGMGLWLRGEVWEAAGGIDWHAVQRAGARAVWSAEGSEGSDSSMGDPDEDPDGQEIDYGDEEDDRGLFGDESSQEDDGEGGGGDDDDPFGSAWDAVEDLTC